MKFNIKNLEKKLVDFYYFIINIIILYNILILSKLI